MTQNEKMRRFALGKEILFLLPVLESPLHPKKATIKAIAESLRLTQTEVVNALDYYMHN